MKFLYRLLIVVLFFILPIYAALALFSFFLYSVSGVIIFMFVYLFTGKIYEIPDKFTEMMNAYVDVLLYCKEKSK